MKDFPLLRGNSNVAGHAPLDNVDRVHDREPIKILVGLQGAWPHASGRGSQSGPSADHRTPAVPTRSLAAQDDLSAAQMRFEFIQHRLDLPALVIQRRQFLDRQPV